MLKCSLNKYNLNSSLLSYTSVSYGMLPFLPSDNLKFITTFWLLFLLPVIQVIFSYMDYDTKPSSVHIYSISQFPQILFLL